MAIFTGKVPGVYTFEASKAGYAPVKGEVTVVDQNAMEFVTMNPAYDIYIYTQGSNMLSVGEVSIELDGETLLSSNDPMGAMAIFTGKVPGVPSPGCAGCLSRNDICPQNPD